MTRASQKEKGYRKDYLSAMGFHGGTQYAEVNEFSPWIQDNNIDRYLISPGKYFFLIFSIMFSHFDVFNIWFFQSYEKYHSY